MLFHQVLDVDFHAEDRAGVNGRIFAEQQGRTCDITEAQFSSPIVNPLNPSTTAKNQSSGVQAEVAPQIWCRGRMFLYHYPLAEGGTSGIPWQSVLEIAASETTRRET